MKTKNLPDVDCPKLDWKLTDPDNHQYGRKVSEGVFQFREFDRNLYSINLDDYPTEEIFIETIWDNSVFWKEDTIVLEDFNENEILMHISPYYNSLEQVKEIYGNDWQWIVAECIFEQTNGLY